MKLMDKKTGKEIKNKLIAYYFGITRLPQDFYLEIKNAVCITLCGKNTCWFRAQDDTTIMDIKRAHLDELIVLNPRLGEENRQQKFWEYLIVM